jgi:hypothetical protein
MSRPTPIRLGKLLKNNWKSSQLAGGSAAARSAIR